MGTGNEADARGPEEEGDAADDTGHYYLPGLEPRRSPAPVSALVIRHLGSSVSSGCPESIRSYVQAVKPPTAAA